MKSPAETIIEKFGGPAKVAVVLGLDVSRIYRWTYPEERGGTGGLIPQKHHLKLLEAARAEGIAITAIDFFPATMRSAPAPEAAA
jgi:hypothetical protein